MLHAADALVVKSQAARTEEKTNRVNADLRWFGQVYTGSNIETILDHVDGAFRAQAVSRMTCEALLTSVYRNIA